MSENSLFADDVKKIMSAWNATRPILEASPTILSGPLPGISVDQVDEVLKTLCTWVVRLRSPHGFRPVFPFARVQLSSAIGALTAQAENMAGNPASYAPGFVTQLLTCFVPLSCATMFADKDDARRMTVGVHAELEQHLALMDTAQRELADKLCKLEKVEVLADEIETRGKTIAKAEVSAMGDAATIDELLERTKAQMAEIEETQEAANELKVTVERIGSENDQLRASLVNQREEFDGFVQAAKNDLKVIQDDAEKRKQLIDSLLSGATSSALATAFSRGKQRYMSGQWIWGLGFAASAVTLLALGITFEKSLVPGQSVGEAWGYLAYRIPCLSNTFSCSSGVAGVVLCDPVRKRTPAYGRLCIQGSDFNSFCWLSRSHGASFRGQQR